LTGALGHQLRGSAAAWVRRGPRHGAGKLVEAQAAIGGGW